MQITFSEFCANFRDSTIDGWHGHVAGPAAAGTLCRPRSRGCERRLRKRKRQIYIVNFGGICCVLYLAQYFSSWPSDVRASVKPHLGQAHPMPLYRKCPNCGSKDPTRNVYRCEAGHLHCDACLAPIITPLLRLRVDTCPKCGTHNYVAVARIMPAGRGETYRSPAHPTRTASGGSHNPRQSHPAPENGA